MNWESYSTAQIVMKKLKFSNVVGSTLHTLLKDVTRKTVSSSTLSW